MCFPHSPVMSVLSSCSSSTLTTRLKERLQWLDYCPPVLKYFWGIIGFGWLKVCKLCITCVCRVVIGRTIYPWNALIGRHFGWKHEVNECNEIKLTWLGPCLLHVVNIDVASVSPHPQSVYSSRYIVPGDRQRKQRAPQFGVDTILKDMLVGVVIWKGNTVNK